MNNPRSKKETFFRTSGWTRPPAPPLQLGYLVEQDITPSEELATAVWYALRTETCAYQSKYSALDREILLWSTKYGSPALLSEIENAPLHPRHFLDLKNAIEATVVYRDVAFCWVENAENVEIVGQIADLIVRCKGVERALCGTLLNGDSYISVRTSPTGGNATNVLLATLGELGLGGGHEHRAGGKIEKTGDQVDDSMHWRTEILERWLVANQLDLGSKAIPIFQYNVVD